ncbi:MAG TPA: hypothetical protein ENI49_03585 [Thermoplasmatales archaeon]|nr:hypothetical protein [Thermoplasmatales archaeon]
MKKTYWESNGKYQKEYDKLYKKLVPDSGKAKTTDGELLRCMTRIYYEAYNNGWCNDKTYEIEYINSYRWDAHLDINVYEKMPFNELEKAMNIVIEFLLKDDKNAFK